MYRKVLLPAKRPSYSDEARHHPDDVERQLSAQGVENLLRADKARPDLDPLRRRAGHRHLQVQIRRYGRRRVRMSMTPTTATDSPRAVRAFSVVDSRSLCYRLPLTRRQLGSLMFGHSIVGCA